MVSPCHRFYLETRILQPFEIGDPKYWAGGSVKTDLDRDHHMLTSAQGTYRSEVVSGVVESLLGTGIALSFQGRYLVPANQGLSGTLWDQVQKQHVPLR